MNSGRYAPGVTKELFMDAINKKVRMMNVLLNFV